MIGTICAATIGTHSVLNRDVFHMGGASGGVGGIPKPSLIGLAPNRETLLNSLPQTAGMLSPHERMHTPDREGIMSLVASQAFATGNPFWARKRIQEEEPVIN